MIQSFDTQLKVSLRALNETIAPALAGADKHVVEQLHLVMAALAFIRARLPDARKFFGQELALYIALARDAVAILDDHDHRRSSLLGIVSDGTVELESGAAEIEDFQLQTRKLREALARLISEVDDDDGTRSRLRTLVLEHEERTLKAARSWCLPLGFELNPEELPEPAWTGK